MLHAVRKRGGRDVSRRPDGGNFLIPNGTFVVELVIFLVVLGIIAKWILPPLQEVAETRRARIRSALQEAERAAGREPRTSLAERDRVLAEARAQARGIIDDANQGADAAARARPRRGVRRSTTGCWTPPSEEMESECRRVREELVGRLDALVVAAAERVLGSRVDAEPHRALIDEAVVRQLRLDRGRG